MSNNKFKFTISIDPSQNKEVTIDSTGVPIFHGCDESDLAKYIDSSECNAVTKAIMSLINVIERLYWRIDQLQDDILELQWNKQDKEYD